MSWTKRIRSFFRQEQAERELNEELQHHIELKTQENIEAGMSAEEARYAALRAFGGIEQKKEQCRDADRLRWLEDLIHDLRYGLRQLRHNPGFSAVAVLTLSLGIGVNAAIFSVAYLDLIRPLPYPQANRLVMFGVVVPGLDSRPFLFRSSYLQLRNSNTPFESMASWRPGIGGCNLQGPQPARMACAQVESTFLSTFGVHPVLGRNFSAANDRPGAMPSSFYILGLIEAAPCQGMTSVMPQRCGRKEGFSPC